MGNIALNRDNENYRWFALSCTALGTLLSSLSTNTLMIALPVISKDLNSSLAVVMWTMMIYMLSITVLVPSIGRVADIIGRKQLYVCGFLIFTISSLLCGLVGSGWQLVAARFIQSVGGSLMLATSTAIVADAFPPAQLGFAMGIIMMVFSVGGAIGPVVGGLLATWNWRWIFFVNIPLGLFGTVWAAVQLKDKVKLPKGQRFDWPGTILFSVGLTLLLLALSFGDKIGWLSPYIMGAIISGLLILAVFFYVENRVPEPMLDPVLFRQRLLAMAYLCNFLNGIARGAVPFLMVFFFQIIWSIPPLQTAFALLPFALAMMISAPLSGRLSDQHGSRGLSTFGLLVAALGILGLTQLDYSSRAELIILYMVLTGLGSGLFFSPNTSAIMQAVSPERRGIAAATRTMLNNAGALISMAMGLAFISSSMSPQAMQALLTRTQIGSEGVVVESFLNGVHHTFWLSFLLCLVAVVASFLRGTQTSPDNSAGRPER